MLSAVAMNMDVHLKSLNRRFILIGLTLAKP